MPKFKLRGPLDSGLVVSASGLSLTCNRVECIAQ